MSALANLKQLEDDLWEAADELRANGNLPYNEFFLPVMGIIFLRHAANRFESVHAEVEADRASGKLKRAPVPADYIKRRSLFLPEAARYDRILAAATSRHLGAAVDEAMSAIEETFAPLKGVLPKGYAKLNAKLLEDLMRIFNRESIRGASGDVFGRIYEYFLRQFAMQKAHDDGEFFTPPSLVQMIVNVIEPGLAPPFNPVVGVIVADLAAGSGGMFVQTSHFVEELGGLVAHKIVFYGYEKTATTIQLAKMNLAVHGLEGHIAEANTYYEDPHTLVGKCDRVMANPPFNVDKIDATKVEHDRRLLPFGLPGVNKQGRVSNGNYLWISYFYSYLNPQGRAGFVMSAQASSAGGEERTVRRKLIETGHVDVMIAIRGGFFYTRTVPCELWFLDRNKAPASPPRPSDGRGAGGEGGAAPLNDQDHVLMLDARNVHRQVNRTVYDFSPEQLHNLTAIVWLYRGERDRFLRLLDRHLDRAIAAAQACFEPVTGDTQPIPALLTALAGSHEAAAPATAAFASGSAEAKLADEAARALATLSEHASAFQVAARDARRLAAKKPDKPSLANLRDTLEKVTAPLAASAHDLAHEAAEAVKLATRLADSLALNGASDPPRPARNERGEDRGEGPPDFDLRALRRLAKDVDAPQHAAVAALEQVRYFHRHAEWLLHRFPDAEFRDVPGLCKAATRAEIEAADWSLSPGRYVGVAPAEEDDDFDFEETMRGIHTAVADLNKEAAKLAKTIHQNFEELVG